MRTFLLIDGNYLCHRSYHTTGHLHFGDVGTGVAFGVFRDIITLYDKFNPRCFVFCFDTRANHRTKAHPGYKASRTAKYDNATPEEQAGIDEFRKQAFELEHNLLPQAGFSNVFSHPGYEADDLIAVIAKKVAAYSSNEAIIVSADQDLWQCLQSNVYCYNPHSQEFLTADVFEARWGLRPEQWPCVKAWAGCKTDDIEGIPGVGEVTAAKYVRGLLTKGKAYAAIKAGQVVYEANLPLVTLPWPGCPLPKLHPDQVTAASWQAATASVGFASLAGFAPAHLGGGHTPPGVKPRGFGFDGK